LNALSFYWPRNNIVFDPRHRPPPSSKANKSAMHELEKLREWVGRRESAVDEVTRPLVHRMAATLDRDDPMPKTGDVLPYIWHLVLFPRVVRHSQIGPDGHPRRGDFLPPVPLPRRLFAGRRVTFHDDLRVGDEVRRDSFIKDVKIKSGRSGTMVLLTLGTEIFSPRGMAISEEHDVIYRPDPVPGTPPAPPQPAPGNPVWKKSIVPDPVMVFRFSALCFNGHRIHYDHPYVTGTEGYPGVVVPGSLHTTLAVELARERAGKPLRYKSMAWRNVRPLYAGRPITLCGEPAASGRSLKLWVMDADDALSLTIDAELHS
jgi:3-methylfumaryl-CoA hydratase